MGAERDIIDGIMADMNQHGDWRDFNEHPGNVPSLESCVEGYGPTSPAGLALRRAELAQLRADATELAALRADLASLAQNAVP